MPTEQEIVTKMKELEHLIGYRFNEINNLKMAMNVEPHPNQYNKKNYCNHALAELGDAVLKTVLSHELFKLDCDRNQITDIKRNLESNESLNRIDRQLGYYRYAYNSCTFYNDSLQDHQKLPHSIHDLYIEAVIGAIFLDGGFEKVSEWIYGIFGLDKLSGVLESRYGKKVSEPIPHWPRW